MSQQAEDLHRGSPERFGYSWNIYREFFPESQEQFWRWTSALPREFWHGARFLDAGCGNGRNSHWAMAAGAVGGVAVDVDARTLAAARRNLDYESIEIRHRSIYEIDSVDEFDIVFSIGVIHHHVHLG